MKTLFSIIMTIGLAKGASIQCPDFQSDSISVSADCPGLGTQITTNSGTNWILAWNDNLGKGDYDFNDLMTDVKIDNNGTTAIITYLGGLSSSDNQLWLSAGYGELFLFSNNSEVDDKIIVNNLVENSVMNFYLIVPGGDGGVYYTGLGSSNSDNEIHDWVGEKSNVNNTVPESSNMLLTLVGMVFLSTKFLYPSKK